MQSIYTINENTNTNKQIIVGTERAKKKKK